MGLQWGKRRWGTFQEKGPVDSFGGTEYRGKKTALKGDPHDVKKGGKRFLTGNPMS